MAILEGHDNGPPEGAQSPTYTLSCQDMARIAHPLVYVRRRLTDGEALYIGSSIVGLTRAIDRQHHKARLAEGEVLEIYLTDNPRDLEEQMILREQPELNHNGSTVIRKPAVRCPVCEKLMVSRNRNTVFCSSKCQKAARISPQENRELRQKLYDQSKALEEQGKRDQQVRDLLGEALEALSEGEDRSRQR